MVKMPDWHASLHQAVASDKFVTDFKAAVVRRKRKEYSISELVSCFEKLKTDGSFKRPESLQIGLLPVRDEPFFQACQDEPNILS